ncbi:MAG: CBS domain-containing protein [Candidatus Bathyarchaeia archaeon]
MGLKAPVESVMRSPPVTALFSDTISSIADKMFTNNIGSVIVMSGGVPAGMVTERDIVKSVVREHKDPTKTRAQEIMSTPLVTIEGNKSIRDAIELMRDKNIRRLAVTKNGRLVGIVSERRLLEALI